MNRLAVIADVHGNVAALEAVLADIAARAVSAVIDLGDRVSGPLWPRETLDLLESRAIPAVRGNHDRWIGTLPPAEMGWSDRFAAEALAEEQRQRLRDLPSLARPVAGVVACHGVPKDDCVFLTEVAENGRLVLPRPERILAWLEDVAEPVVLCGHSHQPRTVGLDGGRLVVNPGSVGSPGFRDARPPGTLVESGSPHARYALLEWDDGRPPAVLHLAVPYDWEGAARRAEANGRPDWGWGLRRGFAR